MQIFNEIDKVITDIDEFQSNKKIIDAQRNLEMQRMMNQRLKNKNVNNPELVQTATEDLSSGASNRSKTTMCTDILTNSASTATSTTAGTITGGNTQTESNKIQINIELDSQKEMKEQKRQNRREKQEQKEREQKLRIGA